VTTKGYIQGPNLTKPVCVGPILRVHHEKKGGNPWNVVESKLKLNERATAYM